MNYGNGELFQAFGKTLEDTRKDLWNNVVENNYKYYPTDVPGLQTTANFKKALQDYQEAIVNKSRLRDVQIRFLHVGGKYKKDLLQDCVRHC